MRHAAAGGLRHPRVQLRPRRPWQRLRAGEFDLLLTDLMMPEMDGIALIDAGEQIDPALGAIVMTGHGTIDTAVRAMQGGALDYILKPFKLNAILPVIARALDVQRLRRENAELQVREKQRSAELAAAYHDLESFSYSISHDLRAPLRSMDGFAAILESDFAEHLGDEGRRIIGVIRAGSQKMDELIVSLLEFSRAGRSALQLDRRRHDPAGRCGRQRGQSAVHGSRAADRHLRAAAGRCRSGGHPAGLVQSDRQRAQVQCEAGQAENHASAAASTTARPSTRWTTTVRDSTCATRTNSLACFSVCIEARNFREPASDSRLCIASLPGMAAEFGLRVPLMPVPVSSLHFRSGTAS